MKTVELPCDIGDKVYIININWSPCDICPHGKEMRYSPIKCTDSRQNYECPTQQYTVEEKVCEAFVIDKEGVSLPGEFVPYEGFCTHDGCDDKVYYSKTKARLVAKKYQREKTHLVT